METRATRKRPWTTGELFRTLEKKLTLPEILDYGNGDFRESELRTPELTLLENIDYGGSEGIYVTFDLRVGCWSEKKVLHLGTFKTLESNKEALRTMGLLMADFVYEFYKFIDDNWEDFDWTGFGMRPYREDGTLSTVEYCAETEEAAKERARTLKYAVNRVRITDKAKRKVKEYEILDGNLRELKLA